MIRSFGLATLALLAACTSRGVDPIVGEALEDLGELMPGSQVPEEAREAPQQLRRSDIVSADIAAIWASLESDPAPTLMYATSDNGGYVTYVSQFRQSLTLRGSRITATRGLGTDLISTRITGPDPLQNPTPPARWPAVVERSYEFPAEGSKGRIESYTCSFEPGVPGVQVILERRYDGGEIIETCTGPAGRFENHYFVDALGFVWRSLQWVGWKVEPVDLQILEPFEG
jgi:hypothetical protein